MSDGDTQQHGSQKSEPDRKRRRLLIVSVIVVVALIVGAAIAWASGLFANETPSDEVLGSDEAIAAGEKRAAELAGDVAAIAENQTVAGSGLFSYNFVEDDIAEGASGAPFITNQLLVMPTESGGFDAVKRAAEDVDAVIVGVNDYVSSYQLLLPSAMDEKELDAIANAVADADDITSVNTNALVAEQGVRTEASDVTSPEQAFADAATSSQWQRGSWGMQAIGAPVLWDYAERVGLEPQEAGVFDNFRAGRSHDDLAHATFPVPLDHGTAETDPNSHGLHIAGTIGANGKIRGVAPNANLLLSSYPAEHVFLWFGWRLKIDINTLTSGITALAEGGASVINVSQGYTKPVAAQNNADNARDQVAAQGETIGEALTALVQKHPDLLLIAAAGNSACSKSMFDAEECKHSATDKEQFTDAPIRTSAEWGIFTQARTQFSELEDHILTVGAAAPLFNKDAPSDGLEVWGLSQWGADILAPGTQILSTMDPEACNQKRSAWCDTGYGYMNGTSMAAPHVAGTAVALRGANPDLSAAQLKRIILGTANSAPMLQVDEGSDGLASQETSMVNAAAALQLALQTKGASGADVDAILDAALNEPSVDPQLQGSWCPADQNAADASGCLNLGDYLAEHPKAELTAPEPVDHTGRTSLESQFTLCVDGPCESASERIEFSFSPPGSADGSSPLGWPVITQKPQGGIVAPQAEPLVLNLLADQDFTELPATPAGALSSTWCPSADSPDRECMTVTGPSEDNLTVTFGSGAPLPIIAFPADGGCQQYGYAGAPLGAFCPAGVPAEINDFYGIQDQPNQDRIWNAQTGVLMLREE